MKRCKRCGEQAHIEFLSRDFRSINEPVKLIPEPYCLNCVDKARMGLLKLIDSM